MARLTQYRYPKLQQVDVNDAMMNLAQKGAQVSDGEKSLRICRLGITKKTSLHESPAPAPARQPRRAIQLGRSSAAGPNT
jgi:hypothetical protein